MHCLIVESSDLLRDMMKDITEEVALVPNAMEALEFLKVNPTVKTVFCAYMKIGFGEANARSVFEYCMANGIDFYMTTTDIEGRAQFDKLGAKITTKPEVLSFLAGMKK